MENLTLNLEELYEQIKERAFTEGAFTREEWDDVCDELLDSKREFEEKLDELRRADFGLNRSAIAKIVSANNSGEQDHGDFIWRLLVAQRSLRQSARLGSERRAPVAA